MIPIQNQMNGIFIPAWLMQINTISNSSKIAYCVLVTHVKADGKLMLDPPGMADVMGTTTKRFLSHINELAKMGLIKRTKTTITFIPIKLEEIKTLDVEMAALASIQKPALSCRGSRLDPDWTPPIEDVEYIKKRFPKIDIKLEHEKFIDYWLSKTGKGAIKKDWIRVWKNWMRSAETFRRERSERYKPSSERRNESVEDGINSF